MSLLKTIASLGIKETVEGIGSLAKDLRVAITGDLTTEQKVEVERGLRRLEEMALRARADLDKVRGDIIMTEAQGESWLQRNWRPVLMLTFGGIIFARWVGLTAPNLTPELEAQLFEIVKIGIGGYIVGRTGEKITRSWKDRSE
jgi:hypothetical protein